MVCIFLACGCAKKTTDTELHSIFKSDSSKERFYKAYDSCMAAWKINFDHLDVHTSYGTTHINVCGAKENPPLILLPVMTFASITWYPNISELSKHFRIYAVNIIGDHGKSEMTKIINSKESYADWMRELLDSLQIQKTNIAGESYGGFITLSFALYHPERINKAVAIAPAPSIIGFKFSVRILIALIKIFPSILPTDIDRAFSMFSEYPDRIDPRMKYYLQTIYHECDAAQLISPQAFSDEELCSIKTPTLVIVGEHEPNYDCDDALERAKELMPNVETVRAKNAKHFVNIDQTELVNKMIVDFCSK